MVAAALGGSLVTLLLTGQLHSSSVAYLRSAVAQGPVRLSRPAAPGAYRQSVQAPFQVVLPPGQAAGLGPGQVRACSPAAGARIIQGPPGRRLVIVRGRMPAARARVSLVPPGQRSVTIHGNRVSISLVAPGRRFTIFAPGRRFTIAPGPRFAIAAPGRRFTIAPACLLGPAGAGQP